MTSSPRLSRDVALRAAKDLFDGLKERKLTARFSDAAVVHAAGHKLCTLPGFTLFTPGKAYPPYKWFLPKVRSTVPKFLEAYEAFAVRVQGTHSNPGRLAARIYPFASTRADFLRVFSAPQDWRSAATLLVASAQWLGAEVEAADERRVQARLGPGLMEVTEHGCWSTARRSLVHCAERAEPAWPVTAFPATQTGNPHLLALAELAESLDPNLQYAGTVLAATLNQGVVSSDWLRDLAAEALLRSKVHKVKENTRLERAAAALVHCTEVLENVQFDVVPVLYEAAVPGLLNSRQFRSIFGVPTQAAEGRETRPETRQHWQEILDQKFEDLRDANI